MNRESLDELKKLIAAALELPEEDRARFVEAQSAPDGVKAEALRMLEARGKTSTFLGEQGLAAGLWTAAGRTLAGYELLEEIGRGGSATVYRARRATDSYGQIRAVKVFDRASATPEGLARFEREAQGLARCEHPYIVRLIEAGRTAEGVAYLVTDLVEGLPLDEAARGIQRSERIELFLKIAEAVAYAHRNLLVHRDLKPSNILVGWDMRPRLLDFGIALLLDEEQRLTETGLDRMTPRYASPEQIRREKRITTQTDVYTLGVLLYELLCGRSPYGENPLMHEVALRIEAGEIERPPRGALEADLEAIVLKAMALQPEDRYGTVDELAEDLKRYVAGEPVRARRPSTWYVARKLVRRQPLAAGLLAALLAVLAVSGVVLKRQRDVAERRSHEIGELAGSLMHDLGRDLWRIPGTFRYSALLYENQVVYLKRLLTDNEDDHALKRKLISALFYHGMAQGEPESVNMGRLAAAQRTFGEALALAEDAYREQGGVDELMDVCHALNYLGKQDRERGNWKAADGRFAECESRLGAHLRKQPEETVDAWFVLAFSKSLRALAAADVGDSGAFVRRMEEAISIRRSRIHLMDGVNRMREGRGLSFTLAHAAEGALKVGETRWALECALEGIEVERGEFQRDPISTPRYFLATHLRHAALARGRLGEHDAARSEGRESVEHFERLLGEEPFAARYDRGLSMSYAALAEVEERAGRKGESLGLRRRQLPLAEQCAAREPESVMVQKVLEECRSAIARLERGPDHSKRKAY